MTKDQFLHEIEQFSEFVREIVETEDFSNLSIDKCFTRIEHKFERFDLDMTDVIHLLEGKWICRRHPNPVGGVQYELHGTNIEGEATVIVASKSENKLKISNIWKV